MKLSAAEKVTVQSLPGHSLLQAALSQKVNISYACTRGGCGMCKVKVESGKFQLGLCSKTALDDLERRDGIVLACKTFPEEDVTITFVQ
ncbi:2Fe-2S iron-sulfur cluster-binding protein [Bacillus thermotolerans]|nr:2Fe-2S iron-sulfur cluster binding domain-containing protein [Bacillus thermotolerans]KKB36935.1 hypothetical protein QY97_00679 [Bacillus thermotolerans]